uniref:D-arabinitol 2-dehydrogenase [ribulose-forming] n=1 Tax=Anser brachyrhynchus TaxID=132585 RepID=A0A8B9CJA5_9AVES
MSDTVGSHRCPRPGRGPAPAAVPGPRVPHCVVLRSGTPRQTPEHRSATASNPAAASSGLGTRGIMHYPAETPAGLIAENLLKAQEIALNDSRVPTQLRNYLQKALDVAVGLDTYPDAMAASKRKMSPGHDSGDAGGTKSGAGLQQEHSSSCLNGQIFEMFIHMIRARKILLIGKLKGYSILAIAEELPDDGKIFACAEVPYLGVNSQEAFDYSSDGKKISMRVGPIADTLEALHAEDEHFDMVFIDADQRSAVNYYSFVMDNHLLRMDGVICVENTLMKGQVYLENISEENVLAVRKLNTVINSDPRVEQIILPVQNGLSIIRRSPAPPDAVIETKKEVLRDDIFWGYNKRRILDRLRLDDKVAYVTGGGQGIGRAFAHALGEAGAKVAVVDLVLEKAEAVAHELSLKGIKSIALAADVSKPKDVQRIVDTIVARWGTVDIACNNAGINMNSASEDTSLEEWDKTFNVNLRGLFLCCQAAGRIMLNQGYGKIINTASMASLIVPHPQKQLAYNASKAGVVKLTQTLGTEWIDRGVKVNCISPGIVDTALIRSEALQPLVRRWLADIPAGRLARGTDLQAAVVFLASEASDYMTGHNLVIEGGQSLW